MPQCIYADRKLFGNAISIPSNLNSIGVRVSVDHSCAKLYLTEKMFNSFLKMGNLSSVFKISFATTVMWRLDN